MQTKNTTQRKKQIITLVGILGLLVVICVGVSILTAQWVMQRGASWQHDEPHGHQWLHDELGLSDEESAAIDAFEEAYRTQRSALLEEFNRRIANLGTLIASQDNFSQEVELAIHRIHEVHGQLQELSIRHYYDMINVLPPEKQDMLRELAVNALSQPE